jgi:hypothetical protein
MLSFLKDAMRVEVAYGRYVLTEDSTAYRMRLDGVAYMTYALMTLFVPLKLWCRRRAGGWDNIGLDDYMTVIALLFANGFFWTCMIGMFSAVHSRALFAHTS